MSKLQWQAGTFTWLAAWARVGVNARAYVDFPEDPDTNYKTLPMYKWELIGVFEDRHTTVSGYANTEEAAKEAAEAMLERLGIKEATVGTD